MSVHSALPCGHSFSRVVDALENQGKCAFLKRQERRVKYNSLWLS